MAWDGIKRRADDNDDSIGVRLALLEKGQSDAERRHIENKESMIAIHKRISDMQKDFAQALDKGIDAIIDKMDSKEEVCKKCSDKVKTLEGDVKWISRWLASAWASIVAGIGLIVHHGVKHP